MVLTSGQQQAQGFRNRRSYLLEFAEGHQYHGLQARTRPATLGAVIEMERYAETERAERSLIDIFRPFADVLVWWNVEDDDGTPVPATLDGMLTQDSEMMAELVHAWQRATTRVSAPKEQKSTDGSQSVEALIPMEPLSESHAI